MRPHRTQGACRRCLRKLASLAVWWCGDALVRHGSSAVAATLIFKWPCEDNPTWTSTVSFDGVLGSEATYQEAQAACEAIAETCNGVIQPAPGFPWFSVSNITYNAAADVNLLTAYVYEIVPDNTTAAPPQLTTEAVQGWATTLPAIRHNNNCSCDLHDAVATLRAQLISANMTPAA